VHAAASTPSSSFYLLALGDSRGGLTVLLADARAEAVKVLEEVDGMSGRPILCLDAVRVEDGRFLLAAGSTAGELGIFEVRASDERSSEC
jgi:hypothetical protein